MEPRMAEFETGAIFVRNMAGTLLRVMSPDNKNVLWPKDGKISGQEENKEEGSPKGPDLFSTFFNPFGEPRKMEKQTSVTPEPRKQREAQVYRIPLPSNESVAIQIPVPLSEGAWQHMMAVLEAMKPGLVSEVVEEHGVETDGR